MAKELLGVTMIVTILKRRSEKPQEIKAFCDELGIKNKHIELKSADE